MVTRRKYKSGGAVPIDDVIATDPAPAAPAPPPDEPIAPPFDDNRDAVLRALEGTQRAEELQRQAAARPQTIEQIVDSIPGISDHKKRFLKDHPELVDPSKGPTVRYHYQAALDAGVPDDSEAMNRAILAGLQLEKELAIEHARRAAKLHSQRSPDEESDRLDAELELARISIAAERSTPIARNAALQAERIIDKARVGLGEESSLPSRALRERSIPISAPVSRDVPTASGARTSMSNRTLSPAEVEIAHNSFTDTTMSKREKELLYLQNREKLHRMRESGEYRRTTEQSG